MAGESIVLGGNTCKRISRSRWYSETGIQPYRYKIHNPCSNGGRVPDSRPTPKFATCRQTDRTAINDGTVTAKLRPRGVYVKEPSALAYPPPETGKTT